MTPAEIEALKALCDAATPGPWWVDTDTEGESRDVVAHGPYDDTQSGIAELSTPEDAAFIAAARTAVPALLSALEEARRETARLQAAFTLNRSEAERLQGEAAKFEAQATAAESRADALQKERDEAEGGMRVYERAAKIATAERDALQAESDALHQKFDAEHKRANALQAEVERLREERSSILSSFNRAVATYEESLCRETARADSAHAEGLKQGRDEGVAAVLAERALWHKPTQEIEDSAWRAALEAAARACDDWRSDRTVLASEALNEVAAHIRALPPPSAAAEVRADALQRERDEMEKSKWYERDRRKEAESRADALQAEVERLKAPVWPHAYAMRDVVAANLKTEEAQREADRQRARADAAWRAALEAAAKVADKYANCYVTHEVQDGIRSLPPPSATPAAPCAHPAGRRVGPPGLGFSVCGVCLANIPAPPPSATPNEET